jgi:hypothetical protein
MTTALAKSRTPHSYAPATPLPSFFGAHMSAGEREEEQKNSPLGFGETERITNIAATALPQRLLPLVQAGAKWNGYELIQTPRRTGDDLEQQEAEVKSPEPQSLWEERVSRSTGRTYWYVSLSLAFLILPILTRICPASPSSYASLSPMYLPLVCNSC